MKKSEAIGIIYRAAQVYNEQLCNKRLLIIYKAPNDPKFIEAVAAPSNFLHLTGVKSNNISAEDFYNAACGNRLRENDFDFKNNTTEQKLNVLIQTLRISTNAKIIGDFNNGRLNLQTDKLAGSVYSCMGFIKSGDYYIPNTILEDDIRKNINGSQKVLAIISKHISEPKYNEIKYVAKKIDIQRLLEKVKGEVPIDEKLLNGESVGFSVNKISYAPPLPYGGGGAAVLSNNIPTLGSLFEKAKENIGFITRKEYNALKKELASLKEQLFQKDKQIEKQDSLIAKKDSQISTLLKLSDELAAEKANLEKAIEQRNGVIKRTNLWLNANPDVKARISKDKREHTSVFALKPTENEKQSKSVSKHKDSPKLKR